MALSSYAELKTAIQTWLGRPGDTSLALADFVALCEARVSRDLRVRAMEERVTALVSTEYVALPAGFLEMRNFQLNTNPVTALSLMSPEQIDATYAGSQSGQPKVYAIIGNEIQLAPAPDTEYTAEMTYWKRFTPLSDAAPTNWLLENAPDVYLFGALAESAPFIGEDQRYALWDAKYKEGISRLQMSDDRGKWSGSAMQVRTDTGNP